MVNSISCYCLHVLCVAAYTNTEVGKMCEALELNDMSLSGYCAVGLERHSFISIFVQG